MGRDGRRTLLVVSDEVALFAALKPELDGEMLQVAWSMPGGFPGAVRACAPWPWGIVGATGERLETAALAGRPVAWWWLGSPPAGLPPGTRTCVRWRDVLADVRSVLWRTVGGLRLAPNRGVVSPCGLVLSADLEGLLAAAPEPVRLRPRAATGLERLIQSHRLPVTLVSAGGGSVIEAADAAAG